MIIGHFPFAFSKLSTLDFDQEKTTAAAAETKTAATTTALTSSKEKPKLVMLKTRSKAKKASHSKRRRKNIKIRGWKIIPSHDEGIKRAGTVVVSIIFFTASIAV